MSPKIGLRGLGVGVALLVGLSGCATSAAKKEKLPHGYVYFCDGAGGGGVMNWSGGLRQGLKKGGFQGAGEIYPWNTGLGVVPDQNASVQYKRGKARKMAQKAGSYLQEYPEAPVTFIGLSAGTTVVVYGMEEMPAGKTVDHAVLCGASISSTYDLTKALRNLEGEMYVFTSQKDSVLGFLVPMSGTADRASGSVPAAGLRGFRMPASASPETRKQYAKVRTIPWRPEFAQLGYAGGHTDVLRSQFVAAHIAPRIVDKVGAVPPALASTKGEVRNPDYDRWAKFGVGSYVIMKGYQEHDGARSPVRLKTILKSKSADRVLVEREMYVGDHPAAQPSQVHSVIAEEWIDPKHHPVTDPRSKIKDLPAKRFTVKGRTFSCPGKAVDADHSYPDWGSDLTGTVYRTEELPGGLAALKLDSHFQGKPFKFDGEVVDFKIVK